MRPFRLLARAPRFLFSKASSETLKALRESTGAPLLKCKEALEKFTDIEQAKAYLREKNLIFADKKDKNTCSQGVMSFRATPDRLIITTFNSETDFVAKNADFLGFVDQSSDTLAKNSQKLAQGEAEFTNELLESIQCTGGTLLESQKLITARIQEKIKIAKALSVLLKPNQLWGVYQHKEIRQGISPGISYVILEIEGKADPEVLRKLAEDLAVLVFCKGCKFLALEDLPKEQVEKKIAEIEAADKAILDKKPADVRKRIVHGKIMKEFGDDLLMEQTVDFAENEVTVAEYLRGIEKKENIKIKIKEFKTIQAA